MYAGQYDIPRHRCAYEKWSNITKVWIGQYITHTFENSALRISLSDELTIAYRKSTNMLCRNIKLQL